MRQYLQSSSPYNWSRSLHGRNFAPASKDEDAQSKPIFLHRPIGREPFYCSRYFIPVHASNLPPSILNVSCRYYSTEPASQGEDVAPPKRSLLKRILDELVHYYHGFRLLFIDIKIASRLAYKLLNGDDLSRREYRQLTRTTADIFRLVPFSIFVIVPFMEFLLPVFLKFFPGMLPSTFQTAKDKESKMKQQLKIKLDVTKFLASTLDEMSFKAKGEHHSHAAKQFSEFFSKIRSSGQLVTNEEIIKFSKLFEDEITLDSLSRPQLIALCRLLELQAIGPDTYLRFQLRMALKSLKADDKMIQAEGVNSLTVPELQVACRSRGMRAFGVSEERLRKQLQQWLELSLDEKIPQSLLLLSRCLYLPENLPPTDQLKATIQSLPKEVATEAKYKIGETEGKVDNKTRLELIRQEEAAIQKEEEEERLQKERKQDLSLAPSDSLAKAAGTSDQLSKEDIDALEQVVEEVEAGKKSLAVEKEELEDLKEDVADYKEEVEEVKESTELLRESKAAKVLLKRLDKMINSMDRVISELEVTKQSITEKMESLPTGPEDEKDDKKREVEKDNLVAINELLDGMRKLQSIKNEDKIKTILDVLDSMDVDHDGKVDLDHVVKVLEVMTRENVDVSSDQFKDLIKLLIREELEKDAEEASKKQLKQQQQQQEQLRAATTSAVAAKEAREKQPEQ